ncbi:MAG: CoA transferase [Chloroflexi bacterium]|nr:CoA transferase [Chloroflexota bacterium]
MGEQPFSGVTVIELGQFVAVPYCGQLLADGGARVIKVEPLEGEPTRHLAPLVPGEGRHFLARNRGKHSLPLDLRHERAAGILERLLASADVLLLNMRPGLDAELGLDHATLAARFPRLIVGNVTAFGRKGPDAHLAGMDLVVAARSGLMAAGGRLANGLPASADTPLADYMCALLLSFGIATALFQRTMTGAGSEVNVSLLSAALTLQNNLMVRVESVDAPAHDELRAWLGDARASGTPFAEQLARNPSSRTSAMTSIYYRTFGTADGAIAVACVSPGLQRKFMKAVGLTDSMLGNRVADREALAAHYAALQIEIEALLATKTTKEWQAIFDEAGTPASAVFLPFELLNDPQPLANGLLHDMEHPALGPVRVLAPPLSIGLDGFRPGLPTAPFGSETRVLLAGLGLTEADIEACIQSGAVGAAEA